MQNAQNRYHAGIGCVIVVLVTLFAAQRADAWWCSHEGGVETDDIRQFFRNVSVCLFRGDGSPVEDFVPSRDLTDGLILDVEPANDGLSIMLFRHHAYNPAMEFVTEFDVDGDQITVDVFAVTVPKLTIAVTKNILEEVIIPDLPAGDYEITGRWYYDGEFRESAVVSHTIPVPEPGSLACAVGLAGLLVRRRR